MNLTRQVAHNTIIQISGKVLSTILGLIAVGMMTRYLGQEQFGWYITATSFLQFIGIVMDFGLIPVTAQMLSEPQFDKQTLFKNLLGFRLTSAVLFLAFAPLTSLFFPYPHEVKIAIGILTIAFFSISINQIFIGLYQTKLKMHIVSVGEVLGRMALVAGVYLLIKQNQGFLPLMITVTVSSLVYTVILWIRGAKETAVSLGFDWPIWRTIMHKMWPVAISIIFNVIYLKGDVILLSLWRDQAEVGVYGAAYRVLDIVAQTAMMMMGVMLPLLAYSWSRSDKETFRVRYQQSFDALMAFAVPSMVGVVVLATPIMKLVAGPTFAVSGGPLRILALAVFGLFLGAVFGHTAVAIDKQKETLWIYISDAILTLIGYLIFIPRFGMYGAAWMSVFSEVYAGVLLMFVIRHYAKEILSLRAFMKIILSSLIMTAAILVVPSWHILLVTMIGAFAYALTLIAIGGISKQTIKDILSLPRPS